MLAEMIADRLGCDVHRIQAADPYTEDYAETVQRSDGAPSTRGCGGPAS